MSGSSKILMAVVPMLAVTCVSAVRAAEHDSVDRVLVCANESDDARRLACYDREIAGIKSRRSKATSADPTPAPPSPVAAATAPAQPAAAAAAVMTEESFGLHGSEIARQRKSEEQKEPGRAAEVESITARVTAVSSRPRGEIVITLDNGQAWVQKKPEPYFPVKVGDAVTINSGMLGSFRLVNGKRTTQVTRVK